MTTIITSQQCNLRQAANSAVVESVDELQAVTPAWIDLLERGAVGWNIYNDPRVVAFTVEPQPPHTRRIFLLWRDGELVCVAPFYIEEGPFSLEFSVWRLPPLHARTLRLFGESIIIEKDVDPNWCLMKLASYLKNECIGFDFLQVFGLNYSDVYWHAAMEKNAFAEQVGMKSVAMRKESIHQVILKRSFEEYTATLSPSTRQTLRYSTRRFFADPNARFERITDAESVDELLESMKSVSADSWQSKTFGSTLHNDSARQAFLEHVAEQGWLRSYVLMLGNDPVAYQLGYHYRDVYYLIDTAYKQQYSQTSPGSVLMFRAMEDLHHDRPPRLYDFGFGDMPYKRRFADVTHDAAVVYFVPPGRWRVIFALQTSLNRIYDSVRDSLVSLKIDRFVRKLIKRQK